MTDVCEFVYKFTSCLCAHNSIAKAPHGFVAENVCESIFLSTRAFLTSWCTENVVFLGVDRGNDDIGAEVGDVLEFVNLGQRRVREGSFIPLNLFKQFVKGVRDQDVVLRDQR